MSEQSPQVVATAEHVTFGGGVIRFALPSWADYRGARPTSCRSCSATVLFVNSRKTGRYAPINPDGTSHFATCPQADAWRRGPGLPPVARVPADPVPAVRMSRLPRASGEGVG